MTFSHLINFIHLISSVIWIGGMIFINFVFMPSMAAINPSERGKIMGAMSKRFSIIAWHCLALLLITGLIRTPHSLMFDMSVHYGIILTFKHLLVLAALIIGLIITFGAAPKMRKLMPKEGEAPSQDFFAAQSKLKALSMANMIVGIGILISVSLF